MIWSFINPDLPRNREYHEIHRDRAHITIEVFKDRLFGELDIQRTTFPQVYANLMNFCNLARQGWIISGALIADGADLRVYGVLAKYPCYHYYGLGCNNVPSLARNRRDLLRQHYQLTIDSEAEMTSIEHLLGLCSNMEAVYHSYAYPSLHPIPGDNPILQHLIGALEDYHQQYGHMGTEHRYEETSASK